MQFEIEGERFDAPELHTLTLRESQILYEMTQNGSGRGIVQEDFEREDPAWDDERKASHRAAQVALMARPDFKLALATIAYRRVHRDVLVLEAQARAENANTLELTVAMILGSGDTDPTGSTSRGSPQPPGSARNTSPLSETEDSGTHSGSDGTEPGIPPATIGISESDISSPGALPTESGS